MKLDLDNPNVREEKITVESIRDHQDGIGELADNIDTWLDQAQGDVFSGAEKEFYIVIKVVK